LVRHGDEGGIEIDNNAAQRTIRTVALGRKNYLLAGSDAGGERAATIYSMIGSAQLDPEEPARSTDAHRRSPHHSHRGVTALADRRKPTARNRAGSVNKNAGKNSAVTSLFLPNIAELIADGEITVGVLRPIGCVATATDGHNCLAIMVRPPRRNLDPVTDSARSGYHQSVHRRHRTLNKTVLFAALEIADRKEAKPAREALDFR
jgi:hypothetical protein